jgi:hypothetical protein
MYGSVGAYYVEAPLRAVAGLGATATTTSSASPVMLTKATATSPTLVSDSDLRKVRSVASIGLTGGLILAAVVAVPAALGGIGYWIGGKVAPTPAAKKTYQWSGAAANIVAPGLGLLALALIGAAQAPTMASNPRRRRRRSSRRSKKSR